MQTVSTRFSMRSERAAGEPDRPPPRERSRRDDEDRSRLEERRPSREWDRDQSLPTGFSFVTRFTFTFTSFPLLVRDPLDEERPDRLPL